MLSLAADRPFECAPHATRSFALALTLSLNLAIVVYALLPSTPFPLRAPPPQSLLAAVLPQPPPTIAPPDVPILRVAEHVATPRMQVPLVRSAPLALPSLPATAPIAATPTATATTDSSSAAAVNAEATIAYATATPPAYPIDALRNGVAGTVMLKVLVDVNGKPLQVMIERGSGSRLLDEAARKHVLAAWRFHPAMRDGHAIEAWALVPVQFNLDKL